MTTATEFGRPAHDPIDPDLDDLDTGDVDDLTDLRAELNADVSPTVTLDVTGRPGWQITYRVDFTGRDVDLLRKKAKDRKFADGVDGVRFAALLLGLTCQGIHRTGKDLPGALGVDGPVLFTTPALQDLLGTSNADTTVRKLYGLEGHVDAAARRLMAEAGWGDEADLADPTE